MKGFQLVSLCYVLSSKLLSHSTTTIPLEPTTVGTTAVYNAQDNQSITLSNPLSHHQTPSINNCSRHLTPTPTRSGINSTQCAASSRSSSGETRLKKISPICQHYVINGTVSSGTFMQINERWPNKHCVWRLPSTRKTTSHCVRMPMTFITSFKTTSIRSLASSLPTEIATLPSRPILRVSWESRFVTQLQ